MDAYELGNAEQGRTYLTKAIELNPDNAEAYQQNAIVIAREKDLDEAERLLEKAIHAGLSDDGIAYTRAEIAFAKEDYDEAKTYFLEAKDTTDDPYTKMRAYLKLVEIGKLTEASFDERLGILSEAEANVEAQYRPLMDEQMAQLYIDRFGESGDEEDANAAIAILQKLADDGFATFQTYENMVLVLQSEHKIDEECEVLDEMLDMYGDDYRIYMYYAYAEVLRQETLVNEKRSYKAFLKYYEKASALYEEQAKDDSNPLMQRLEENYQQAKSGNWL